MSIVDQLDLNLYSEVNVSVKVLHSGGVMVTLGERDEDTVRIWGSQAAFQRLSADIDKALTGQGDDTTPRVDSTPDSITPDRTGMPMLGLGGAS